MRSSTQKKKLNKRRYIGHDPNIALSRKHSSCRNSDSQFLILAERGPPSRPEKFSVLQNFYTADTTRRRVRRFIMTIRSPTLLPQRHNPGAAPASRRHSVRDHHGSSSRGGPLTPTWRTTVGAPTKTPIHAPAELTVHRLMLTLVLSQLGFENLSFGRLGAESRAHFRRVCAWFCGQIQRAIGVCGVENGGEPGVQRGGVVIHPGAGGPRGGGVQGGDLEQEVVGMGAGKNVGYG